MACSTTFSFRARMTRVFAGSRNVLHAKVAARQREGQFAAASRLLRRSGCRYLTPGNQAADPFAHIDLWLPSQQPSRQTVLERLGCA
jgi:hypothetical protein